MPGLSRLLVPTLTAVLLGGLFPLLAQQTGATQSTPPTQASAPEPSADEIVAWMKAKFRQHSFRQIFTRPPDFYIPVANLLKVISYYTTVPLELEKKECMLSFRVEDTLVATEQDTVPIERNYYRYDVPLASLDPGQVDLEDLDDSLQRLTLYTTDSVKTIKRTHSSSVAGKQASSDTVSFAVITVPSAAILGERLVLGFRSLIKSCGGKEMKELFLATEEVEVTIK